MRQASIETYKRESAAQRVLVRGMLLDGDDGLHHADESGILRLRRNLERELLHLENLVVRERIARELASRGLA